MVDAVHVQDLRDGNVIARAACQLFVSSEPLRSSVRSAEVDTEAAAAITLAHCDAELGEHRWVSASASVSSSRSPLDRP